MDKDEAAAIINRMMRQLDEDDAGPEGAPRCDGCGRREPLQAYTRTTSDGGSETLYTTAWSVARWPQLRMRKTAPARGA
jgi:hypothetical protein